MYHAAKRWAGLGSCGQHPRGNHRSAPARCSGRVGLAKYIRSAKAPQLQAVLRRAAHFADRNVDAEHGPGLAGLSTDWLEDFAWGGCGSRFNASHALLGLGWFGGGSAFETPDCPVYPNRHDAIRLYFRLSCLERHNSNLGNSGARGAGWFGDGFRYACAPVIHGRNDQSPGPDECHLAQLFHREWRPGGWTFRCWFGHGAGGDCHVLFPEWPQLSRGARRALAHALAQFRSSGAYRFGLVSRGGGFYLRLAKSP